VRDTLPAYLHLITAEPDRARHMIEEPMAQRAGRFRILQRAGALALTLLTHWQIRQVRDARLPASQAYQHPTATRAPSGPVTVDLTSRPVQAAEWSAARGIFPIEVVLPSGRRLTVAARNAILLPEDRGGQPRRLVIKLEATDTPTQADEGHRLRVTVTATATDDRSCTASSDPTAVVAPRQNG
jgi:hypothetical protein